MIKYTILCFATVLMMAPVAMADSNSALDLEGDYYSADDKDEVECVARCVRRSNSGACWNYGADFCARGPGVACIVRCQNRNIQGRCTAFSRDYCGVYPECTPHCVRRTVNGRCTAWGSDQCRSWWNY